MSAQYSSATYDNKNYTNNNNNANNNVNNNANIKNNNNNNNNNLSSGKCGSKETSAAAAVTSPMKSLESFEVSRLHIVRLVSVAIRSCVYLLVCLSAKFRLNGPS